MERHSSVSFARFSACSKRFTCSCLLAKGRASCDSAVHLATNRDREMKAKPNDVVSLKFGLEIEDGWPPVAVESLPFRVTEAGYLALSAPLFVKDMSAGDVISVRLSENDDVESWEHVCRSQRSTVWLLRLKTPNRIDESLARARAMTCNTAAVDSLGCYNIDVPADVPMADVDAILADLDEDAVAVAFPSLRHREE